MVRFFYGFNGTTVMAPSDNRDLEEKETETEDRSVNVVADAFGAGAQGIAPTQQQNQGTTTEDSMASMFDDQKVDPAVKAATGTVEVSSQQEIEPAVEATTMPAVNPLSDPSVEEFIQENALETKSLIVDAARSLSNEARKDEHVETKNVLNLAQMVGTATFTVTQDTVQKTAANLLSLYFTAETSASRLNKATEDFGNLSRTVKAGGLRDEICDAAHEKKVSTNPAAAINGQHYLSHESPEVQIISQIAVGAIQQALKAASFTSNYTDAYAGKEFYHHEANELREDILPRLAHAGGESTSLKLGDNRKIDRAAAFEQHQKYFAENDYGVAA